MWDVLRKIMLYGVLGSGDAREMVYNVPRAQLLVPVVDNVCSTAWGRAELDEGDSTAVVQWPFCKPCMIGPAYLFT